MRGQLVQPLRVCKGSHTNISDIGAIQHDLVVAEVGKCEVGGWWVLRKGCETRSYRVQTSTVVGHLDNVIIRQTVRDPRKIKTRQQATLWQEPKRRLA